MRILSIIPGPGPSPFGNGPWRRETGADLPRQDHRRAFRAIIVVAIGERALVRLGATMIAEKGSKCRCVIDPCSPAQRLNLSRISRCTSIRISPITPKAPLRADVRNKETPSDSMGREDRGKDEARMAHRGALDEDVHHWSSFVLSEIKTGPRSVPAPLTGAKKLREGTPC